MPLLARGVDASGVHVWIVVVFVELLEAVPPFDEQELESSRFWRDSMVRWRSTASRRS
jgi:hypothetical protein